MPVDRQFRLIILSVTMSFSSSVQARQQRYRLGAAVGVALFILTQFAFIVHETQHLVHKPGEVCQICIQASHSGNAVPANALVIPVIRLDPVVTDRILSKPLSVFFFSHFSIRAPPFFFS